MVLLDLGHLKFRVHQFLLTNKVQEGRRGSQIQLRVKYVTCSIDEKRRNRRQRHHHHTSQSARVRMFKHCEAAWKDYVQAAQAQTTRGAWRAGQRQTEHVALLTSSESIG